MFERDFAKLNVMGTNGTMTFVITIDGPAASGKSTVSRELAKRLGCLWVSTGAFYRGLAYAALQLEIDFDDVLALGELCRSATWSVQMFSDKTRVFFKNQDVTDLISHEDVGSFASRISHYPEVRQALLQNQRNCRLGQKFLVAEGRDCGTVVFPEANVKIYLTASSQHRAARRAAEQGTSTEEIHQAQLVRDRQDSSRATAPLQVPENALVLDSTNMKLEDVLDTVEKHVQNLVQLHKKL
jgi:cytidylate kinase